MPIARRGLLSVVLAGAARAALGAPDDARRAARSLGSPEARQSVIECFSLTCPHCAAFAQDAFPELKARWIAPGRLRWTFYDLPTDLVALRAAVVARYLPPERYERFIDTLFASQDHWAFADGNPAGLWLFASDAGMDRATFDRAVVDTDLRDWIVGQAMEAESRWHVDSTPSFVVNGRVYEGAMSAGEFGRILAG